MVSPSDLLRNLVRCMQVQSKHAYAGAHLNEEACLTLHGCCSVTCPHTSFDTSYHHHRKVNCEVILHVYFHMHAAVKKSMVKVSSTHMDLQLHLE
jgi:hypothetical protein